MHKVELTDREIKEVGTNRHNQTVRKRSVITFIVGLLAVVIGAYYWEFMLGKIWMITAGTVWVGYTLYQARQAGKAGLKFLENIKSKG